MKLSLGCDGCRIAYEGGRLTVDLRNRLKAAAILGAFVAGLLYAAGWL